MFDLITSTLELTASELVSLREAMHSAGCPPNAIDTVLAWFKEHAPDLRKTVYRAWSDEEQRIENSKRNVPAYPAVALPANPVTAENPNPSTLVTAAETEAMLVADRKAVAAQPAEARKGYRDLTADERTAERIADAKKVGTYREGVDYTKQSTDGLKSDMTTAERIAAAKKAGTFRQGVDYSKPAQGELTAAEKLAADGKLTASEKIAAENEKAAREKADRERADNDGFRKK